MLAPAVHIVCLEDENHLMPGNSCELFHVLALYRRHMNFANGRQGKAIISYDFAGIFTTHVEAMLDITTTLLNLFYADCPLGVNLHSTLLPLLHPPFSCAFTFYYYGLDHAQAPSPRHGCKCVTLHPRLHTGIPGNMVYFYHRTRCIMSFNVDHS